MTRTLKALITLVALGLFISPPLMLGCDQGENIKALQAENDELKNELAYLRAKIPNPQTLDQFTLTPDQCSARQTSALKGLGLEERIHHPAAWEHPSPFRRAQQDESSRLF